MVLNDLDGIKLGRGGGESHMELETTVTGETNAAFLGLIAREGEAERYTVTSRYLKSVASQTVGYSALGGADNADIDVGHHTLSTCIMHHTFDQPLCIHCQGEKQ